MDNLQQPNQPLGTDPNFLRYLQGFLAKPKNADLLQGKRISSVPAIAGQGLVLSSQNIWTPSTVLSSSGQSDTVTLAKITGGGSNGSLTFVNGLITAYVKPT